MNAQALDAWLDEFELQKPITLEDVDVIATGLRERLPVGTSWEVSFTDGSELRVVAGQYSRRIRAK